MSFEEWASQEGWMPDSGAYRVAERAWRRAQVETVVEVWQEQAKGRVAVLAGVSADVVDSPRGETHEESNARRTPAARVRNNAHQAHSSGRMPRSPGGMPV